MCWHKSYLRWKQSWPNLEKAYLGTSTKIKWVFTIVEPPRDPRKPPDLTTLHSVCIFYQCNHINSTSGSELTNRGTASGTLEGIKNDKSPALIYQVTRPSVRLPRRSRKSIRGLGDRGGRRNETGLVLEGFCSCVKSFCGALCSEWICDEMMLMMPPEGSQTRARART